MTIRFCWPAGFLHTVAHSVPLRVAFPSAARRESASKEGVEEVIERDCAAAPFVKFDRPRRPCAVDCVQLDFEQKGTACARSHVHLQRRTRLEADDFAPSRQAFDARLCGSKISARVHPRSGVHQERCILESPQRMRGNRRRRPADKTLHDARGERRRLKLGDACGTHSANAHR